MPVLTSSFAPPRVLANGHVQTVLAAMRPRLARVAFRRERLELADGDFLDLDWMGGGAGRTVILTHGLEGSSGDPYVRGMAAKCAAAGWDVLAWNFRGCGGEPNRLPRAYHSGDTPDLAAVIAHAARRAPRLALAGFSLGGNMTLKYLGEREPHPAVAGAAAISAPVDLASSARAMDRRWSTQFYLRRLVRRLVGKVRAKAAAFPGIIDVSRIDGVHGFGDFDNRFTAPMHGFRDAEDYWTRSSARQFLPSIRVPALLINALDDPFLTPGCFPVAEARASAHFHLEMPACGGHLGFIESVLEPFTWAERRVAEFLLNPGG
jgi:predicted alpha/beta-fold hydrolase